MTVSGDAADIAWAQAQLDDPLRLAAVRRVLLPGSRSQGLDRLTALATDLLRASYAQVSLISDRQVVLGLAGVDVAETEWGGPREDSLCTVTVSGTGPLIVSDAAADPRVSALPPVTGGLVGSYLGVPLVTSEGHVLGSLCVYDGGPRAWSPEQVGILGELAASVVAELELRAVTLEVATSAARLDLALSAANIGSFDWDLETDELQGDDRLIALFGYDKEGFETHIESFRARVHPDDVDRLQAAIAHAHETGEFTFDFRIVRPDREVRHVEARGRMVRGIGGRAYAAAEAATTRLALLADATTRLSASLEPRQVLETLADIIVPSLGVWLAVAMPEEAAAPLLAGEPTGDPNRLQVVHVAHGDRSRTDSLGALLRSVTLTLQDPHGPGAVVRERQPEWLPSAGAALTMPLLSRGRCLGALSIAEPVAGSIDRRLLVDLVARAAVAFDNALLYGTERRTGITLQRSLLPREIARPAGVDVAVRYLPGATGAFIGGDWYQGVPVEGGLLLAMGDVMGHGMRSAARMGQLRAIVATLALEGHAPGELLLRLATHCDALLDLELATLLVAHYDPSARTLTVASAGHPPPLLAPLGEEPAYVEVDPGPPLGTVVGDYDEVTVEVPAGATLVLYTDGLVENREEPLSEGLERLRQALREVKLPPERVADHVLRVLGREQGGSDDVALLVLNHATDA